MTGPVLFTLHTTPLASIINRHNLKHHFYVDDSQFHSSTTAPNPNTSILCWKPHLTVIRTLKTGQRKIKFNWMVKRQKQSMLVGTNKTVLHFRQHYSTWWCDSHTLWLSNALVFSSSAHCPCKTSLIKLPNPVTTSFAEAAMSRGIFPLMLQWSWSLHSFCRLDYCNSLLFGSPAVSTNSLQVQRIQNCAAHLILTTPHLCFKLSTGF